MAVPAHAQPSAKAPAVAPVAAAAHNASGAAKVAPLYRNPLKLKLPDGSQAASCADPSVLRVASARRATHWYLYCTSDALSATELGPDGTPLIHNVPTFRSTDLVHWTYAGDAFKTKPAWISGGMWAPDVVRRGNRYFMYFTASDTTLPGGGSAIALATSTTPTGPWKVAATPVVPPDSAPPNQHRWEFDPEIIKAGSKTYIYFGSYFGGIHIRRLSADGRTSVASTEKPIAIDNRYEGTYIVHRNGWYYFMGSATNCCNGPLTGYSVFVARSRSPLGPFRDKHGVSILKGRVGGTPMLTQNGNRWVGAGHNTIATDYSGKQWIIYHAVDKNHPYYAGNVGYTKRPALMDPLDWRGGWPVVQGGHGPSNRLLPGPAAQPGEHTAYRPRFVIAARPAHRYRALSDAFTGSALSSQWSWVRPPAAGTYSVTGGKFAFKTQTADLHPPASATNPLASVLTERAPKGDYVVETKVSVSVPAEGCCHNFVQGGLVIYRNAGNYVKLASVSIWNTRQTEFGKNVYRQPAGYPTYGNTVVGPVGKWTYLRIVHQVRHGVDAYTAYTSLDGRHWDHGGTWDDNLGAQPRIGLISMGGAGFTSTFEYVRVSALRG